MKIKDLLLHQAGLKSYQPFWKHISPEEDKKGVFLASINSTGAIPVHSNLFVQGCLKDSMYHWLCDSPLNKKTEEGVFGYSYSDLGFMMLSRVIELNYNTTLDVLSNRFFYAPLGMTSTYFQPWKYYSLENIAPTEMDKPFRGELIKGWVHDRNASIIGGVSGHAGLFSNVNDLAKMLQMFLNKGHYGGSKFLDAETVELFTSRQDKNNRRGLGWDKSGHLYDINNTSKYGSESLYGHTGFTGTAVWVDPAHDLIYIFLSNRVYPQATNVKLQELNTRTKIHDIVYEAILD